MQRMKQGVMLVGATLTFSGCLFMAKQPSETQVPMNEPSAEPVAKSTQKFANKNKLGRTTGDTLLDFNYPINIVQEPINNRFVGILAPHMQVSDNLKPYIAQFQEALLSQIQEIFQKRGYQVLHFTTREALTPAQRHKTWAVLDLNAWVGVLEDIKMQTSDPAKQNLDVMVDQSSGSLWFNFFEPETGRVIHNFGVDVSNYQAVTHTYSYRSTNSGGFYAPGVTNKVQLIKDKDDAIRRILNEMYVKVIRSLVAELTDSNVNRYSNAIEKIKR
ncbi:HpaA family protein [Helicobacter salomonis]|uniref:HpaA family protein n=2 Tax=Helicobacter salomonis TaxID=56878 RepID=UPI000CF19FD4|nr:HpaA family protein [Helicobacter salomonis]